MNNEKWVMVPVEPTAEMIKAAREHHEGEAYLPISLYAAMIAAAPTQQYNHKRIGWELERTAMGDGYYGNALRAAKDIPGLTVLDRAVLDRYATGSQHSTDHIALLDIAMRVYTDTQPAPIEQEAIAPPVAWQHRKPIISDIHGNAKEWSDWIDGQGLATWPHRPLYTTPQPAPTATHDVAGLVEAADAALREIQDIMYEAYNSANPVCCGRPGQECCGSPVPGWSEQDQRTMDRLAPHQRALNDALATYRKES